MHDPESLTTSPSTGNRKLRESGYNEDVQIFARKHYPESKESATRLVSHAMKVVKEGVVRGEEQKKFNGRMYRYVMNTAALELLSNDPVKKPQGYRVSPDDLIKDTGAL